ncbi:hypothetical protein HID58_089770 [Brassica napus]|uniref:RING-type domain-containing protein n=1 Tax=Brassica napus TaxID=3708 RepID=A0ABQ7Y1C1_BRANA|nr:hypothetical protein HID58_089770 [Brassica napus]
MAGSATNFRWKPPPQPQPSQQQNISDSDSDSGSDSDNHHQQNRHNDLSNSIFKAYLDCHSSSSPSSLDLSKIQSFLASSSSGAVSCLICLERIKRTDPTWSCTSSCFAVFHLFCIQNWARQCLDVHAALAVTRPSTETEPVWNCPKCRSSYLKSKIPSRYLCYCGKEEDPPADNPWILPHSCGEVCERGLSNNCGHRCLLLCHPGPCASCPKLVKSKCFCGGVEDVRRCGHKLFSCGDVCDKVLDCEIHKCREICHDGECPPCRERAVYRCCCGKVEEEKDCCERVFRCEGSCESKLNCGKHVCERGCHGGECGLCPYQGKRSCPCGKKFYQGLSCDVAAPLCGGTCDKVLGCGYHRCPERCHRGACLETCRIVVTKSCRCGGTKKQVPCRQDVVCERKCQRMRDCGKHPCRRRCCDGQCPPCSEICGKKLKCRNHKCQSPCHRGQCAPCPIMVSISCACGQTHFEAFECLIPLTMQCRCYMWFRHGQIQKPHKCHYGACPPCRLPCDEEYPCGHKCKLRCHGPRPPPNREFILKPTKKMLNVHVESTPGSPCPRCPELVWRPCVGHHLAAERMMVCSDKTQFACDNLCGNPLPCGNHYCSFTCHPLEIRSSSLDKRSESCEKCELRCQKERSPRCQHPCPRRCHPEDCPPCKTLVKRSCHCGAMVHAFECIEYNTLSEKEQSKARSCRGPCHRANSSDPKDVVPKNQFGVGLLPCDSNCKTKQQMAESVLQQRNVKEIEEKEEPSGKNATKRRKRRERGQDIKETSRLQKLSVAAKKVVMLVMLIAVLVAVSYYGYKGILWLSDWMNEVEEQRQKSRRYPRI